MSKRASSSQSNTLFNYFQSPKGTSNGTPKSTPATPKSTKRPPKSTHGTPQSKPIKTEPPLNLSLNDDDDVVQTPKRRKVAIIDSDSEEEKVDIKNIKKCDPDFQFKVPTIEFTFTYTPRLPQTNFTEELDQKPVRRVEPKSEPIEALDLATVWLHNRLEFLKPESILDKKQRRPDHPDYDSRTLHVPRDFLDKQTPAMRQWWILKSDHMDSVLFFKVGKFYELYHMDAVVGVNQLGFSYMKGEFAHSGFPESAYHKMANALIEKGYKVARVEQTETPEMMADRCKKRKSTKFDKVVAREICQVTTKATCVYTAQLPEAMHAQACYMFAIIENDIANAQRRFGVCFIDTSIGVFHLSEFDDDNNCTKLLACFSEYPPGLILIERKKSSAQLKSVLSLHYNDIRKDTLAPDTQFFGTSKTIEHLLNGNYFKNENNEMAVPQFLQDIIEGYSAKPGYEMALNALGGCLWYLMDSKLDIQVVSMGKFKFYNPMDVNENTQNRSTMILDAVTMINLELLGERGSLQKKIDYCQTSFGKRLLQQWICRPLCNIAKIKERQEAIAELYNNSDLLQEVRTLLKKLPDLERQLAKIHTFGNKFYAKDHPDSRAIFYEAATYSKRKIADLLSTLRGFELAQNLAPMFQGCQSSLLKRLTQFSPDGMYIDLSETLNFFKTAFDQEEAKNEGKIIPKRGVDENYDQSEEAIAQIKKQLDEYLIELQNFFGCKVSYFGADKKRFQIDVPEPHTRKATSEFKLEGCKKSGKASKRYSTDRSRQLLADMMRAESERGKIIQDLNRRIFEKFSRKKAEWELAIECISLVDVLSSAAQYARSFSQDMCIPIVEPMAEYNKIEIQNGRHPCISNLENFVPNDTKMGTDNDAKILLITGPNMGGKSTLMRQVAIICIMAHMGGYVPASRCRLNLIDRIFTRLGAHDDIVQGLSTFMLELSEAASILHHATPNSLVLLDELGRGTSTHDGNAIATAYVEKLVTINCRTLFSTHYHSLVDHFENRDDVQLGHMACMVENDDDPTEESVTFLYKIQRGRCPKSYGFNVARLAGLNHSIVSQGRVVAKELEEENSLPKVFRQIFKTGSIENVRLLLDSLTV